MEIKVFQSTLPTKGATGPEPDWVETKRFQSTLPTKGATDEAATLDDDCKISIHAPN